MVKVTPRDKLLRRQQLQMDTDAITRSFTRLLAGPRQADTGQAELQQQQPQPQQQQETTDSTQAPLYLTGLNPAAASTPARPVLPRLTIKTRRPARSVQQSTKTASKSQQAKNLRKQYLATMLQHHLFERPSAAAAAAAGEGPCTCFYCSDIALALSDALKSRLKPKCRRATNYNDTPRAPFVTHSVILSPPSQYAAAAVETAHHSDQHQQGLVNGLVNVNRSQQRRSRNKHNNTPGFDFDTQGDTTPSDHPKGWHPKAATTAALLDLELTDSDPLSAPTNQYGSSNQPRRRRSKPNAHSNTQNDEHKTGMDLDFSFDTYDPCADALAALANQHSSSSSSLNRSKQTAAGQHTHNGSSAKDMAKGPTTGDSPHDELGMKLDNPAVKQSKSSKKKERRRRNKQAAAAAQAAQQGSNPTVSLLQQLGIRALDSYPLSDPTTAPGNQTAGSKAGSKKNRRRSSTKHNNTHTETLEEELDQLYEENTELHNAAAAKPCRTRMGPQQLYADSTEPHNPAAAAAAKPPRKSIMPKKPDQKAKKVLQLDASCWPHEAAAAQEGVKYAGLFSNSTPSKAATNSTASKAGTSQNKWDKLAGALPAGTPTAAAAAAVYAAGVLSEGGFHVEATVQAAVAALKMEAAAKAAKTQMHPSATAGVSDSTAAATAAAIGSSSTRKRSGAWECDLAGVTAELGALSTGSTRSDLAGLTAGLGALSTGRTRSDRPLKRRAGAGPGEFPSPFGPAAAHPRKPGVQSVDKSTQQGVSVTAGTAVAGQSTLGVESTGLQGVLGTQGVFAAAGTAVGVQSTQQGMSVTAGTAVGGMEAEATGLQAELSTQGMFAAAIAALEASATNAYDATELGVDGNDAIAVPPMSLGDQMMLASAAAAAGGQPQDQAMVGGRVATTVPKQTPQSASMGCDVLTCGCSSDTDTAESSLEPAAATGVMAAAAAAAADVTAAADDVMM